jgi:predicted HicB family RNase H-like nuclease
MTEQRQEVFRHANQLFSQEPDWVTFFREILGVDGIVRRLYRDGAELAQFEQSDEYKNIQQMLAKLREKNGEPAGSPKEPTRVITVRMPKSLHESLKTEAYEMKTSMNKLCISKLLQVVDEELVPCEASEQGELVGAGAA